MFKFSKRSGQKLNEVHVDLGIILRTALCVSEVDFTLVCGHRPVKEQQEAFAKGYSRCDGVDILSEHNYVPSLAMDICAYAPGQKDKAYDYNYLCYLAGVIMATAKFLKEAGTITHDLRWGGNWDGDGIIISDQKLKDLCHFELVKAK